MTVRVFQSPYIEWRDNKSEREQ